jgi:membrane protein YqaA with SNARE-associated domain
MNQIKVPHWLQAFLGAVGGGGLFFIAFLDSSVLSLPFVTDTLVIELSVRNPARMPYYAGMAALGSLAGCIWIYLLAKKGGEVYFHRHAGAYGRKTRKWVEQNGFISMFISSILPPPLPLFKIVVIAEGVFQVPIRTFILALLFGRGVRFFAEGIFAVRYGTATLPYIMAHTRMIAISALGILFVLYMASWVLLREAEQKK